MAQVWCKHLLVKLGSGKSRTRSNSTPARPYVWRFSILSRLMCPSTGPLLHLWVTAASPALRSMQSVHCTSSCSAYAALALTNYSWDESPVIGEESDRSASISKPTFIPLQRHGEHRQSARARAENALKFQPVTYKETKILRNAWQMIFRKQIVNRLAQ
jgi:hypothetical protein